MLAVQKERGFKPYDEIKFKMKSMFEKGITQTQFIQMIEQLERIENNQAQFAKEISQRMIDVENSIAGEIALLEAKIASSKEIVVAPASLVITGGANSKATISVPQASFTATSSNPEVVTVYPGNMPGSFVVNEVAQGYATITIKDNATPPNTATVRVTAS